MTQIRTIRSKLAAQWPIALSMGVAVCFSAVAGVMLLELRRNAGKQVEDAAQNLVRVIEQDVGRNIELMDLSVRGAISAMSRQDAMDAPSDIRQLIVFDRAATAKNLGAMIIFDREGKIRLEADSYPPRGASPVVDRDYFKVHLDADIGRYISKPYVSRLLGDKVIGVSRRINGAHGEFDGVGLATIKLSYFTDLFKSLQVGSKGVVTLLRTDGTVLARHPAPPEELGNFSNGATFQKMLSLQNGSFVGQSAVDGVERLFTIRRVPDLPLIVSVSLATQEIYAEWWQKALTLGWIVLITSLAAVGMTWELMRQLAHRTAVEGQLLAANAELARLSGTDALTGLGNRRRFDEVFESEIRRAQRTGKPLALIMIDVDQFKQFNDTYGHQSGDAVLIAIATSLRASTGRPGDIPFRIGGEEFAVMLSETGENGAGAVAERIRKAVFMLDIPHETSLPGRVSISVGVAILSRTDDDLALLYARADTALYQAKREGRNRVVVAKDPRVIVKAA